MADETYRNSADESEHENRLAEASIPAARARLSGIITQAQAFYTGLQRDFESEIGTIE